MATTGFMGSPRPWGVLVVSQLYVGPMEGEGRSIQPLASVLPAGQMRVSGVATSEVSLQMGLLMGVLPIPQAPGTLRVCSLPGTGTRTWVGGSASL